MMFSRKKTITIEWFTIRNNDSDKAMFNQVFVSQEYWFLQFKNLDPKYIIDAGANTGDSCIWFHQKFPQATIVWLEPEQGNCDLCIKNAEWHERITILKWWLRSSSSKLTIKDAEVEECAYEVYEDEKWTIQWYTVDEINIIITE